MIDERTAFVAIVIAFAAIPAPLHGDTRAGGVRPRFDQDQDRVFILGRDGWILERFGRDVAILRTNIARSVADTAAAGLLVMSCEADARRWRLSFNERILTDGDTSRSVTVLLRPSKRSERTDLSRIGQAEIVAERVLTVADDRLSAVGFVSAFVRLLKAGTNRIDFLIRSGPAVPAPSLFKPIVPAYVFKPIVQRTDLIAFDDFLASCAVPSR